MSEEKDKIAELKEQSNLHDRLLSHYKQHIGNTESVLKDHLETHLKVSKDQLKGVDRETLFREFDQAIKRQIKLLEDGEKETLHETLKLKGPKKANLGMKVIEGKNRSKPSREYFDLGMIFTDENGDLFEYKPSTFITDFAKKHKTFSLFGLMFPETEDQPSRDCSTCKHELNLPKTKCDIDGCDMGSRWEAKTEKPSSICTLIEQRECYSYKTILCLSPKITTCMYGKTELEKEKLNKR